jgi:hypothetical protein
MAKPALDLSMAKPVLDWSKAGKWNNSWRQTWDFKIPSDRFDLILSVAVETRRWRTDYLFSLMKSWHEGAGTDGFLKIVDEENAGSLTEAFLKAEIEAARYMGASIQELPKLVTNFG